MDTNTMPQDYTTPPAYAISPRQQVKKCYNRACLAMLFQYIIANVIVAVPLFIYQGMIMSQLMLEEGITDPVVLSVRTTELMNPMFMILLNAIAFLIANPVAYLIGNAMTKKYYKAKPFSKIQLPAVDCVIAVLAVLGLQGFSLLVQYGIMSITQMSGINEATAAMFTFSDNMAQNVIMVIYFVFIAAITEELLCRGLVLKLFSPVSKKFAVVASAVLFGVMHGNFNQMFNGFLLGLVIGYVAVKSKSIWIPIICHMVANTNAMVLSYFEYKIGEDFFTTELIYGAILTVIAIVSIVLLLKRNGKIDEEKDGFPVEQALEVSEEEKPKCKWKALLSTPCFWIFIVIYAFNALLMLTPLA
ncbi:MAG: CPBP family intramembrane metalloprotease [Oscillospiraceae bacterium]|nr:CPBP family intramembrane metalloprotease [Oscillospiraceae bacterium]